jgi:hypothetical protein
MVFDKSHAGVFQDPPKYVDHFYEQTYLNIMLFRERTKIRKLLHHHNRMSCMDQHTKDHRLESQFVHYAGLSNQIGFDKMVEFARADLNEWQKMAPSYHLRKTIKISVGGGLGDQIESEPVVRAVRNLHPHDRIIVASHWPEIFEDLPYEVESVDIRNHFLPPDQLYAVFHTYSSPDTDAWKYMTHVFTHSTDFSSQLAIRRVLPSDMRDIKIRYTDAQLQSMYEKLGVSEETLREAYCVHPGRSWRTKTMSTEFWEEIISGLWAEGKRVVVFGKDGKGTQGLVPVKLPVGVIDARDKLTIKESLALLDKSKVLISNDSAPIHLAGATDIWICGVYTAKHPEFVIPYRGGRQDHKVVELNHRPKCWPCNIGAQVTCVDEIRADFCLNFDRPFECFPKARFVLDKLLQTIEWPKPQRY